MNPWFRRFLVILTVGGGFLGAAVVAAAVVGRKNTSALEYAMYGFTILLYVYGIFAGVRLTENPTRYRHLIIFHALQIPFISSPGFTYRFACGLHVTIGMVASKFVWAYRLGSDWQMSILQPRAWGIGVNLVAAVIFVALLFCVRSARKTLPRKKPDVAVDIPRLYRY